MPLPTPIDQIWPLEKIVEDLNSRKVEIDDGIRELCHSIVANGLLQPLIILDTGHLVAGYRRLAALRLGEIKSARVSVYPSTLTPSERRIINLTENVQRLDLSDPEIYLACSELMELNDWQRKDLAAHLGKSPSMVTMYLSPSELIPEARQAFLDGKFGFTIAYSIVKNPNQQFALNMTLGGATRSEVDAQTKGQRGENENASNIKTDSIKVIVGGVTVTVKKKGDLSLDDAIRQLPEALKELEREKGRARRQDARGPDEKEGQGRSLRFRRFHPHKAAGVGGCVEGAPRGGTGMEKPRNDLCGCCGRGVPAKVIDQSLIDTGEWPAITAPPEPVPMPVDTADRKAVPTPSHPGRGI